MLRYTIEQIEACLPGPIPRPATAPHAPDKVVQLNGFKAAVFEKLGFPDLNAAMQANLACQGFGALPPDRQNAMIAATLGLTSIAAMADAPRSEWLPVMFALAHAEQLGATDARRLALEWCQTSKRFVSEDNFLTDWNSFRAGGTTIGTLLGLARDEGFDIGAWFGDEAAGAAAGGPTGFFVAVRFDRASLRAIPWIVDGFLSVGNLTVLAAAGGGAKTALAISLCAALAAGRSHWGSFSIRSHQGGRASRVAYLSGEEGSNATGLMIAATCDALGLTAAQRALVSANLMMHEAGASGWKLGAPRPDFREDVAPELHDQALILLRDALKANGIDVLVLDTVAALFNLASENDNMAISTLMSRLARVATEVGCAVLLLHHTPKMTRESAAGQRGEPTLLRGGSAFANSARAGYSLTGLPPAEAGLHALAGMKPDSLRRLDCVKLNDRPPPDPMFLQLVSVQVQVADGSSQNVRAIQFLPPPPTSTGSSISDAMRNVVMKAIDAGALVNGIRIPLSPGGGKQNARDAIEHIARALRAAQPGLGEAHAKSAAREVLHDLRDRIGCVIEQDVSIPKRKANGTPNGRGTGRGLVCRWDLAPWMPAQPTPAPPTSDPTQAQLPPAQSAPGQAPASEPVSGIT